MHKEYVNQKIKDINVKELHLWTENPRDPVDTKLSDLDIIKHAIDENPDAWNLDKLANQMGDHYDLSELPTVVYHDDLPVVYDGNRRIAVLKYIQDQDIYSKISGRLFLGDEPQKLRELTVIPCNVCDKETALINIERKHGCSGSWGPLERDYFAYRHRGKDKSLFIKIDEQTRGFISKNRKILNRGYVKNEILSEKNLNEIGFYIGKKGNIESLYTSDEVLDIFDKILFLIENKVIDTRKNRGTLKEPLVEEFRGLSIKTVINKDKNNDLSPIVLSNTGEDDLSNQLSLKYRKTPRTKINKDLLFLEHMPSLICGDVNNLYRDILSLYNFYQENKTGLSDAFPAIIRMSLRLLVETASGVGELDNYVRSNFDNAKQQLDKNYKTFLSNNNIKDANILIKLLQNGAHNYHASTSLDQMRAMSIIIAAMISITHAKKIK